MKINFMLAVVLGLVVSGLGVSKAQAQQGLYVGGGAYFGQGGGSCMPKIPREIKKIEDEEKRIEKDQKKIERELDKAEREAEKAKRDLEAAKKGINGWLKPYVAQAVIDYVLTGKQSPAYEAVCQNGNAVEANKGFVPVKWDGKFCGSVAAGSAQCLDKNTPCPGGGITPNAEAKRWTELTTNGPDGKSICYDHDNFVKKENISRIDAKYSGAPDCENGITNLKDANDKYLEAQEHAKDLKAQDQQLQSRLDDLDSDHEGAVDEWQDKLADGQTAGGFCYSCMYGGGEDRGLASNAMSLVGTLGAAALTYAGVRYTNQQNSALGWPTSPWMAYGMGFPLIMGSIYGGMYGGGSGSFGCSGGGPGMNGAFGYPGSMYNPYAGNMMMPGAFPMMGYMSGYPMMGYPAMGMIGGGIAGMMMGMPMMGMPMMGLGVGAMMGMPMMGMPMMGMPMMGLGVGAMMGMPMMGMPMMGMPMMGLYGGYPMAGMMTGYNPMMMQYQQQMLGMYQQQAQMYMAQQQAQMQQQMQGQMMIGQLQGQMAQIAQQIQMISMGVYGGGGYGMGGYGIGGLSGYGTGIGGVGGVPSGFTYAPYNSYGSTLGTSTTTGTTVVPGRGQGFIPASF